MPSRLDLGSVITPGAVELMFEGPSQAPSRSYCYCSAAARQETNLSGSGYDFITSRSVVSWCLRAPFDLSASIVHGSAYLRYKHHQSNGTELLGLWQGVLEYEL